LGNRYAVLAILLSAAIAPVGDARADTFDRSPLDYGPSINRSLRQAGSALRFGLDQCASQPVSCSFSSSSIIVVVEGGARPPRTRKITITIDLIRDGPGFDPIALVADVTTVLAATSRNFDPLLAAEERGGLIAGLITAALATGRSEGNGIDAHYALTYDEGADGLLVITVLPKQ
jgi:hypothetical protein